MSTAEIVQLVNLVLRLAVAAGIRLDRQIEVLRRAQDEGRDPTPEEWAALDDAVAEADSTIQNLVHGGPDN